MSFLKDIGIGSLIGGPIGGVLGLQKNRADRAVDAQVNASNQANATLWKMYDQTRQDQMPWMQAGQGGLNALMGLYGLNKGSDGSWSMGSNPEAGMAALRMDPGYQFRLQEGQRAIENGAAARGGLLSGNALRAVTRYGQDYGSNEFGNLANRYSSLAGVGQSAAGNIGNLGANTASNVGNNLLGAGQARASGYMNQYNMAGNLMNQGFKLLGSKI